VAGRGVTLSGEELMAIGFRLVASGRSIRDGAPADEALDNMELP